MSVNRSVHRRSFAAVAPLMIGSVFFLSLSCIVLLKSYQFDELNPFMLFYGLSFAIIGLYGIMSHVYPRLKSPKVVTIEEGGVVCVNGRRWSPGSWEIPPTLKAHQGTFSQTSWDKQALPTKIQGLCQHVAYRDSGEYFSFHWRWYTNREEIQKSLFCELSLWLQKSPPS